MPQCICVYWMWIYWARHKFIYFTLETLLKYWKERTFKTKDVRFMDFLWFCRKQKRNISIVLSSNLEFLGEFRSVSIYWWVSEHEVRAVRQFSVYWCGTDLDEEDLFDRKNDKKFLIPLYLLLRNTLVPAEENSSWNL